VEKEDRKNSRYRDRNRSKDRNRRKPVTFKFSLDPEEDSDLIYYLLGIKNKNKRGEWIAEAVRLYKTAETTLKTTLKEELREAFEDCFEKLKYINRRTVKITEED